jgi:TPP-dependent pyruvate/acetoin dehydrogenase alpha subunit
VDTEVLRAEIRSAVDAATEAALAMPMPDPATAQDRVFHEGEDEVLLGDGNAPWSAHAAAPAAAGSQA